MKIPFNKPYIAGKELYYIAQAVAYGNISGDGHFTKACCQVLEEQFGVHKALLTPSCTAALEMAAILCDLGPGDEAILPSYTFVSTATSILRTGATPVFVDIRPDTLNLDESLIEQAITPRTKAIFPVHYAGVGCEMDTIMAIAEEHKLMVVEDAAQGVSSYYKGRALGSIGDLGTYSFHETKNYICGEGGALCINRPELVQRAEIIRDKGTNRKSFFRGEVDKYTWVDTGSSYVPSEIACAFLYGQLELLDHIAERRHEIAAIYRQGLQGLEDSGFIRLSRIPADCRSNDHMFYVLFKDTATRDTVMQEMRDADIYSVFHYIPLHSAPMGKSSCIQSGELKHTEQLSGRLLRLPFYYEITKADQQRVIDFLNKYFERSASQACAKVGS